MRTMLALWISLVISYPTSMAGDAPLKTAESAALATLDVDPVLFIVPILKGDPSPVDGRVMDTPTYIALAQRTASAEAERDALKNAPQMVSAPPVVVLLVAMALGGGVALGWSLRTQLGAK